LHSVIGDVKRTRAMTKFSISILAILLLPAYSFADVSDKIIQSGKLDSGKSYSLEIKTSKFTIKPDSRKDDGSIWGIDGGYPRTKTDGLLFQIDGMPAYIPWKFYTDLTDIQTARVLEDDGFVKILIKGGDAAGSYDAEFRIKDMRLVERIVHVGEFYKEVWEKTILHNELWNKDM